MIITREIDVKITESNYQYYDELGYDVVIGEFIKFPIELLSHGSQYEILCKCDTCGLEKMVIFKNYIKYNNKFGEYLCRKCSEPKRKETLRKNFGVDYPIKNKIIKNKVKNTILKKYNTDNIKKIKEISLQVETDSKLKNYEKLLKQSNVWKKNKREIIINEMLSNKIEFSVWDIKLFCHSNINNGLSFIVNGMTFIINKGLIENLKINIKLSNNDKKFLKENLNKITIKEMKINQNVEYFILDMIQ